MTDLLSDVAMQPPRVVAGDHPRVAVERVLADARRDVQRDMQRDAQRDVAGKAVVLTAIVAVAVAVAAAAVWHAADPATLSTRDPELAWLLRGMAVMKAFVVVAALGVLGWRARRPIRPGEALGYAAATVAMGAATAAIWQLSWLVPAAVAFHAGLVGFLVVAWRDDRVRVRIPVGRPVASARS